MPMRRAPGQRSRSSAHAAAPARCISVSAAMPSTSIACASIARTWSGRYNGKGAGIGRFYTCAMQAPFDHDATDLAGLATRIRQWARELGFQQAGIAGVELREDEAHLRDWLAQGQHGRME